MPARDTQCHRFHLNGKTSLQCYMLLSAVLLPLCLCVFAVRLPTPPGVAQRDSWLVTRRRRDLTLHSALPQTLRRASPSCHTSVHVLCTTPAFCTHPQILFGTLSADSALTLFMCSILMLSNQHATPTSQSQHPLGRFATMRSSYSRLIVVCHKRGRLFLEPPGRWHKAHCKVTPVQRTLGKFYRPASITKVPQSSGHDPRVRRNTESEAQHSCEAL